jgi:hypothetical protein
MLKENKMKLNLEAKTKEQELILEYLEKHASNSLRDKINNGVRLNKEGIELVNKKTLDGFFSYATAEARKLADKGANSACVRGEVVCGWAIHYFEENSIEGTLFNLDGTPYKKPVAKTSSKPIATPMPKKTQSNQVSLFDSLLSDEPKIEETEPEKFVSVSPIYKQYFDAKEQHPNHVIVTRLGDFYEAFGDDAKLLADLCNLTLTSRLFQGEEDRTPMVGFPQHCTEIYFNKIKTKYKLAIVENNEIILQDNDLQEEDEHEDDFDDLTLEEMQAFDGDIDEDFGEISKSDKDILLEELYMLFDGNILFGGI